MKISHKNWMKNSSGITLIALVITIIVLLILAGVSLKLIMGNDGILGRAENAASEQSKAKAREKLELVLADLAADKFTNPAYNENEFLNARFEKENMPRREEDGKTFVTVDDWEFEIDRSKLAIISGGGQSSGVLPETWTVIFDANGGNCDTQTIKIAKNTAYGTLPQATRDGYNFLGWYTEIENGTQVQADNFVTADVTLYARWEEDRETDIGVKHVEDNVWIAEKPTDNWFEKAEYYSTNWSGNGTKEDPYLITNEKELAGLSYKVASGETYNSNTYFKLTNNLSMGKHIWVPIGGKDLSQKNENYYKSSTTNIFSGNFDGNNYTISGLYYENITDDYGTYVGLFGYSKYDTYNAEGGIRNVNVDDSYICAAESVGGISGCSKNIIYNCNNNAIIKGRKIGGICGSSTSYIIKCCNTGKITNIELKSTLHTIYAGGIAGSNSGSIYSSYNTADINLVQTKEVAAVIYVGGLTGYEAERIYNSYNTGNISVDMSGANINSAVGGLNGYHQFGYTYNCYNYGNIQTNIVNVGGIIGKLVTNTTYLHNLYFLKNTTINNLLDNSALTTDSTNVKKQMLAYFDSMQTEKFTYTNDTSEKTGYEGDLVTKLNKWISDNPLNSSSIGVYLNWKFDSDKGYPVFDE